MKSSSENQATPAGEPFHTPAETVMRMLNALGRLRDTRVEEGHALNQLDHALQTATRAERAGADDEMIVAALCHDLGKLFTWQKHGPVAAEILRPFVRPDLAWAIEVHEDFTPLLRSPGETDKKRRRRHRWHRGYQLAVEFADEFDVPSVDPAYPTLPLEHFEPMLRRVFETPKYQVELSLKYRLARAALFPLRPFLGRSADAFEAAVLEKSAALYRKACRLARPPMVALKSLVSARTRDR